MYKIPANTLFLGKKLVYVPQCPSTNTLATELGQREELHEGAVIVTDDQHAGRGQRGNAWEAAPGMNLTFSVILRPRFLAAINQFRLNMVVSLSVADYLQTRTASEVFIKWPNDILVEGKKLCGILIENHLSGPDISYAVVGIGLNVNQKFFSYAQAGSVHQLTGKTFELNEELEQLLGFIEARYLALKSGQFLKLQEEYLTHLYRRNEFHRYAYGGNEDTGVITGVDEVGRLRIKFGEEEKVFGIKEVRFI